MWHNLRQLVRYRGLIQSLVSRDLKARYRGSVLGFFWSFVNPLMLLLIYNWVFTHLLINPSEATHPYAVFMFTGLLPWTWFQSSLNEATGSLIAGGNLIKKVLFPAEVLTVVTVLPSLKLKRAARPTSKPHRPHYKVTRARQEAGPTHDRCHHRWQ